MTGWSVLVPGIPQAAGHEPCMDAPQARLSSPLRPIVPGPTRRNRMSSSSEEHRSKTLWNADLAPTTEAQRTWRWYHFAALWVGMVMCIPAYTLAASLIDQGMSPWQAV